MTKGTPIPRGNSLAEIFDAARALAALDEVVRDLRGIADWSVQEHVLRRSNEADDPQAALIAWEGLSTGLRAAVEALEKANGQLGGLSRRILRELAIGTTILSRFAEGAEVPKQ